MGDPVVMLRTVVVNVVDLERAKAFWTALLGVGVAHEVPGFAWLGRQRDGGVRLGLQQVDALKEGRNRVHLDTGVADPDEAQRRIEELGGSLVARHEVSGFSWRVMADPEGNEFCIGVPDD